MQDVIFSILWQNKVLSELDLKILVLGRLVFISMEPPWTFTGASIKVPAGSFLEDPWRFLQPRAKCEKFHKIINKILNDLKPIILVHRCLYPGKVWRKWLFSILHTLSQSLQETTLNLLLACLTCIIILICIVWNAEAIYNKNINYYIIIIPFLYIAAHEFMSTFSHQFSLF